MEQVVDYAGDQQMDENSLCPGCKQSVVDETGGVVVAFGQSFFHVDCFKCAKCHQQVTADTNLLLLSDGSPICSNCSYSCNVCHLPILDEAIMTGDDSYHAHCFKCKVCKNRIDELVFAKTSQGIYCMDCHNARVAKSRRHAQRQKERQEAAARAAAAAAAAGGGSVPVSRQPSAHGAPQQNGLGSPHHSPGLTSQRSRNESPARVGSRDALGSRSRNDSPARMGSREAIAPYLTASLAPGHQGSNSLSVGTSTAAKRRSALPTADMLRIKDMIPAPSRSQTEPQPAPTPSSTSRNGSPHAAHPPDPQAFLSMGVVPSLSVPDDKHAAADKRKSFDDGVRPLNVLFGGRQHATAASSGPTSPSSPGTSGPGALLVPDHSTSRSRKRHSIDPGVAMTFSYSEGASPPPPPKSPTHSSQSVASPATFGRDLLQQSSPFRDHFPQADLAPRPGPSSRANSLRDDVSSVYHSPPTTPSGSGEREPWVDPALADARRGSLPETRVMTGMDSGRPPLRTNLTLDRVPPRSGSRNRLNRSVDRLSPTVGTLPSTVSGPRPDSHGSGCLSPSPSPSLDRRAGSLRSRPTSPSHRADVPHGIESGTDTETEEADTTLRDAHTSSRDEEPPSLPPKDPSARSPTSVQERRAGPGQLTVDTHEAKKSDVVIDSGEGTESPELEDVFPVERTSHATYIAPALPPIRFSMSADLSDLLKTVGVPTRESLDQLVKQSEEVESPNAVDGFVKTPTATTPKHGSFALAGLDEDPTVVVNDGTAPLSMRKHGRAASAATTVNGHDSSITRDVSPSRRPRGNSHSATSTITTILDASTSIRRPSLDSGTSHLSSDAQMQAHITLTAPDSNIARPIKMDKSEQVIRRLQEVLTDAGERGVAHVKLDTQFITAIVDSLEHQQQEMKQMKSKFDGVKRTSQQYIEGLTVAQTEYDRELKARRDAEAEVTRLRILLSGQAARLSAMSGVTKKQELQQQLSQQMATSLDGLGREMSKLKVERDMTLAEVEELAKSKNALPEAPARSLSIRFDNLKTQYQGDLISLTQDKEALLREIAELKTSRDIYLEETTALNARNEELAKLGAQYARRAQDVGVFVPPPGPDIRTSLDRARPSAHIASSSTTSLATSNGMTADDSSSSSHTRIEAIPATKPKVFKWPGSKASKEASSTSLASQSTDTGKSRVFDHAFQQLNVLRFTRCDHCGDKMWGSQYRCSLCHISVHPRCLHSVQSVCAQQSTGDEPSVQLEPLPLSMFGRPLIDQARFDARGSDRYIPVIVEKCIDAVEALAMDYEGIYRKTGGSGQSKAITQLFERGDYDSFDLLDTDKFNDICSVTSVLKNYFRSLPDPLLTYALHEGFMQGAMLRDPAAKTEALLDLVNQLPREHYETLKALMLHLHRISQQSEVNLMGARNLGVVFGPTLMRSRDPTKEFSDMAGKALSIEWLVEQAPNIFSRSSHLN